MERNMEDIVSEVLRSPQLRSTLENAVRNLNVVDNPSITPQSMQNTNTYASHTPVSLLGRTAGLNPVRLPSVPQELQRIFPSYRQSRNPEPRRGCKRKKPTEAYFNRDVILLTSPDNYRTLRGANKCYAFENGYGVSNVEFGVNWTDEEIVNFIKQLFEKYLKAVEFEIMVPVGGRLIKPSLAPGKKLDGSSMKSVFFQKVVYIRPLMDLSSDLLACSPEGSVVNEAAETLLERDTSTCSVELLLSESPVHFATNFNINEPTACSNDNDIFFQRDLAQAVSNSLADEGERSLESIFQDLRGQIKDKDRTHFNIYREDIFNCCIRAVRRKCFNPFNKIIVNFSNVEGQSEEAVDLGGPTREAFRLVIEYIRNSRMFFGESKKYIRLDRQCLEQRQYFYAGSLIALSLIHGGPAPRFFSESLFHALASGNLENVPLTINDLEGDIKEKIVKFNEINDIEVLQDYITEEPTFSIAGCHFIIELNEKDKIFRDLLEFYGYHRIRPALDQFKDGLATGDILNLMNRYPVIFKELMCNDKNELTVSFMKDLFSIDFSEIGSSRRSLENRTISFWRDYVVDCSEEESQTSLEKILIFCTGANETPPLGFHPVPFIMFLHDNNPHPKSNTCALQLHLPTIHKTYDEFKKHMYFGIGNSEQFGFA